MADDRLTTLYNLSETMTAAGDSVKEKHENDYKTIIDNLKTSANPKERILAAQLIARFFKYFPEHEHDAFDSIVDLCESADVDVRKHATMAMISICRGSTQVVSKAADILIQLYQTNQASEVNLINQSLMTLLSLDIEKFLKSFFANFDDGNEIVRERALKFLAAKIHSVSESALTKEIEEQLMNYTKKAMEDVTKDEFMTFIGILSKLKIAKTHSGQATIASAIKSQAELNKEFDCNDKDSLDKFILCTKQTIPFLSQYNRSSEYINYICLKILPHIDKLAATGHDLQVLQALAEMSPHLMLEDVPNLLDLEKCHKMTYDKLLDYLPKPSEQEVDSKPASVLAADVNQNITSDAAKKPEGGDNGQVLEGHKEADGQTTDVSKPDAEARKTQEADFQFTHIEYLMYAFIQLCRLKPELHTESMQIASRKQLSHLSNGCKKYTDALERQLAGVKKQDMNQEENKLRTIALRTTKNISTMIVGLFKRPNDFKTSILLSCKPQVVRVEPVVPANANNNNSASRQAANKQQPNNKRPQHQQSNNGNRGSTNNSGGYNRQVGQKSKFRGNYQADNRNKRPRNAR